MTPLVFAGLNVGAGIAAAGKAAAIGAGFGAVLALICTAAVPDIPLFVALLYALSVITMFGCAGWLTSATSTSPRFTTHLGVLFLLTFVFQDAAAVAAAATPYYPPLAAIGIQLAFTAMLTSARAFRLWWMQRG
jgi:hypothetical protein